MRKLLVTVLIILCGFCYAQAKVVDRIYAQVNDDIITMSDIDRRMDAIRTELSKRYSGDALEQAVLKQEEEVLDALIEEKLLIQKAIEVGIDAEVEPKVSSRIQQIMKENGIEDMDYFEDILEQQGSSLRTYRDQIRDDIMARDVINIFVNSRITLLTQEVEQYYKDNAQDFATPEEVSLSEIIITVEHEGSEEKAKSRASDLYDRLKRGESFQSLAGQYSKGATANKGGSIGDNLIEKWRPDIVKAIEGLESGDVSLPQKTQDGYAIYHVDVRKHPTIPPLEKVETEIKNRIWENKVRPELRRFINRLKEEAYIQIHPESE
ncbi:MAG: SurA N-terminal domain-containing protein [Acidobacteria bacterium]|nr:SurA N-terminal domain-containing protein [Acidobacteriota bacterium]